MMTTDLNKLYIPNFNVKRLIMPTFQDKWKTFQNAHFPSTLYYRP